jgi:hypothetical protein
LLDSEAFSGVLSANSFAFRVKLSYSRSDVLEHTSAMNFVLWPAVALFVVLGLVFVALFRNIGSRGRKSMPADWDSIFSPSRYKPMERLLDPTDYRFLESQPAFNRKMARRVRSNRVNTFRGYARCLARDYSRVSAAVRVLMVHAPVDRSALAGLLLKQRLQFSVNMASLEGRLFLHSLGLTAPTVDVRSMVESLDTLCAQLRALAPAAQPSLA